MFRGVAQLTLDSKGRLAVPSRFRDALLTRASGHVVLTADSDRCLLIYPLPDWEPIEKKLMSLSSFNAQIRELQRRLVGYAEDVVMDATGRILVPPALRRYAQLEKAVVLVGQGHKFDIVLPNAFISDDPELNTVLSPLWARARMKNVETFGCSFWARMN